MKRTAILLAAGCSRRFGTENKLLHLFGSKTMLEAAINALQSTEIFDEIIKFITHYSKKPLIIIAEKHDRLLEPRT